MSEQNFKWCFIGTGTLAKQVAKAITASGQHEIVSVYTRRFEKGQEFADKFGGTAYENAEDAITAEGVQGVYVVTPHNTHYQYAKQALELGKPVLCEKPFTMKAEQTEELFTLAEAKGLYIVEGMWTWFSPIANQVKKWLDDGEFGEIQNLTMNYHLNAQKYAPRMTDPNLAGGALLDSGIYPITYLYRLFGNPTKVVCKGIVDKGIDWEEDVDLTFENGKTYRASISIRDFKGFEKVIIDGEKAYMKLGFFHAARKVKLKRKHGANEVVTGEGTMLNEFNLVAEEIRSGKTDSEYVPHQATLDIMKIMDECRRQMKLVYPFETAE